MVSNCPERIMGKEYNVWSEICSQELSEGSLSDQAPLPLVLVSASQRQKMLTEVWDCLYFAWNNDHWFLDFLPFNSHYHFLRNPEEG